MFFDNFLFDFDIKTIKKANVSNYRYCWLKFQTNITNSYNNQTMYLLFFVLRCKLLKFSSPVS